MTQILQSSKKALLLVALVGILAFAAATFAPEADAANNCTYYSDSSYTVVVGKYGYDCCNNRIAWGQKTQFSQCSPACFYCVPPPRD